MANETEDAAHIRERNAHRLNDDAVMNHMMFMAASLAGGATPKQADSRAAEALDLLRKRFL